ncbi:MAG: twin-arginine translocation signal domain-containing protein [Halobacterium sp.]
MNRRTFLGTAGVAGVGALAGCMNAIGTVAPPQVPQSALDEGGWTRTNRSTETVFEESYGPVTVTAKSTTLTFSDQRLAQSITEKTLGQIDGTMAIYAASHINFSPDLNNLPAAVGREEVVNRAEKQAKDQFKQRMRDKGLTNVRETGEEPFQTDSGKSPGLTTFSAEFPVGTLTYDAGGESFEIEVGSIAVAGDLAVWNEDDYVVVAGGAYPAENYAKTTKKQLSEAITVTVDIDLGLTPQQYKQEVRNLMAATR